MQFKLLLSILFLSIINTLNAQKLTGKVINSQNEPVAGASIKLGNSLLGTTTNQSGNYSITLSAGQKYEIEVSAIGYQAKIIGEVEVKTSADNILDITLESKSTDMEGVVVTAKRTTARMETTAAIIQFQKNTNTVASVISAESIKRSPDRNTGEVLKRTPGASLLDGKFLVVRGLADRYNQAMLNGILLTSTEPDRKTFSFDIIPAQMIDNIIINKAFVPEYPGEWAGGLIQVNTKDIPSKNFFNLQIGTGFNTQTTFKDFYKSKGGKTDWLGIDDGTRGLPSSYTKKSEFDLLSPAEKTAIGKQMQNDWSAEKVSAMPNISFQANGGFSGEVFGKKIGGIAGLIYSKTNKFADILNQSQEIDGGNVSKNFTYNDKRYSQEVNLGAILSVAMQLNQRNKISSKTIANLNSNNFLINRSGINYLQTADMYGSEFTFKQNTFFTTQLIGDHSLTNALKLKWYGAFNVLDGYSPDQRRFQYQRPTGTTQPYAFLIGNSLAQESGSRVFQSLNDYIYTAGGDLNYSFDMFGLKQSVKGGYMLQIKDRLFDAQLFANYLPRDNAALRQLTPDKIFAPENFGDGTAGSTLFAFDAIKNRNFRYLANTILNAGFLQFDNQFTDKLRVTWGLRMENYDQLIGSVKKWDDRHKHTQQTDVLPGLNATYKLSNKTNFRLSGSQTVIRPEFRELAALNLYDFELNASVQGNPELKRTKVTNLDFRYEVYPRAGEVLTAAVFYKHFKNPIEQNLLGVTFVFQNPEQANAYGAEIEFRKKLDLMPAMKNFTFQINAAYINSKVSDSTSAYDRPLQGQSPYLVNLSLLYDLEKAGLNATLLFNQIGKRIYVVGQKDALGGSQTQDVYEAPRPVLDFQIGKKLLQNKAEIRLNVSDIINQTQYFYQNVDDNKNLKKGVDAYRFTRKYGTTFSLTFNYSL